MARARTWILFVSLALAVGSFAPCLSGRPKGKTDGPKTRTIIDRRTELGLSDAQVARVKETVASLQAEVSRLLRKVAVAERDYLALVEREAPLDRLESKLQEMAALQVQLRMQDLSASRTINAILTPQQLDRWREIQRAARGAPGGRTAR
ncbi:MAG: hypothetical protein HY815_16705 [Candidatus Riflebacteria bacterium]|nr:hypothetical protein [Candidatus Riflebacteria bacterium]